MGIRFRCPQGHQLNVKAELAGKRGVCPQCGTKVQIPLPAPQPSPSGGASEEVRAAGESWGGSSSTIEVAKAQAGSGAEEIKQDITPSPSPSPADGGRGTEPPAEVAKGQAVEDAWYVRPPGGGQFGPASWSDFAQWIRDGRVVAEAYIWRAGWPDWRKAGEVADLPAAIPVVAAPAVAPIVEPAAGSGAPAVIVPDKTTVSPRPMVRRRRSANRQLTVAALLLIVTIVLTGVFIWVLNREPQETSRATGCLPSYYVIG
jgi:hypothetical protein